MATTLTYGAVTVSLPDDLLWTNEFNFPAVSQTKKRGITGALLLQSAALVGGRPMVLEAGEEHAWVERSVVEQLLTAAAIPGQQFTLTYRGVAHSVVFDHEAGAVEADPVIDYADPDADDVYVVRLRFLKV